MTGLARYAVVGAAATAVHYGVLIGLVEVARWPAWLGSGLGAVVGAQVAYVGNRWYTFVHGGTVTRSWPRFQATAVLGALVSMGLVALAVRFGWHYLLGQLVATIAAMSVTYAVNRRWTFAATRHPG